MATRKQRTAPIAPRIEPIAVQLAHQRFRATAISPNNPAKTMTAGGPTHRRIMSALPSPP